MVILNYRTTICGMMYLLLCFANNVDGACANLPLIGTWIYNTDVTHPWNFTTNSLSGFTLSGKGTTLRSYYCIASNSANVYVLKSTFAYSDRGSDRWLYLCMKITKVSDNLFYFYFLNDLENSGAVSPQERVYNPAAIAVPSDDLSACNYCKYTTPPPDNDIRKLTKQGTNEALSGTEKLCVPCDSTCNTGASYSASSSDLSGGQIAGITVGCCGGVIVGGGGGGAIIVAKYYASKKPKVTPNAKPEGDNDTQKTQNGKIHENGECPKNQTLNEIV